MFEHGNGARLEKNDKANVFLDLFTAMPSPVQLQICCLDGITAHACTATDFVPVTVTVSRAPRLARAASSLHFRTCFLKFKSAYISLC